MKGHTNACPWRLGGRALCQCGALGTVADQQAEWRRKLARHPTGNWRVQGEGGVEANTDALGDFDEIAVGHWLHMEMMDKRTAFIRVGSHCLWVLIRRDGVTEITHQEHRP